MEAASRFLWRWRRLCCCSIPQRRENRVLSSLAAVDFGEDGGGGEVPYVPVLIVGAGPVGLVLSFLLTKLGIKCAVLEKSAFFSQHPQAHFINNRSMELFRKMDGLEEEIQRMQPPIDLWRKFVYCTSLSGSILGTVDHMQHQDCDSIVSPTTVGHFSQYKLVKLLLKKLESLGFHICAPNVAEHLNDVFTFGKKILLGHECISIYPSAESIEVGVSFVNEGKIEDRSFRCSILVGSDGARSSVRKLAGIHMKGERDLQNLVSIHFLSRDLGHYLLHQRPGMLYFVFNPEAIGVLVAHDLDHGEFVLQVPYYPPQQKFEDINSKVCEEVIFKLAGRKLVDIEIMDIKPWVMHAEVAESFVSCNNRVILVGDAAHRFPPAGGFGMNTGIQDAHNLAWKISSLLNGVASSSILQTYELERRPVAIFNTALSVQNFKAAMSVPAALGLDPTVANSVHRAINSSIGSIFPPDVQKLVLEGLLSVGRSQVSQLFLNENNPIGSFRLAKLRRIFDEGRSLQLQFPAEDLGFRYTNGAIVSDDGHQTAATTHSERMLRKYVPSAKSGSRLPHMQVRPLRAPQSEQDMFSTLDLIPGDKLEFILIIAPVKESYDLASVAFKVAEEFKVGLKVCAIWPQGSSDVQVNSSENKLAPWRNVIDVEEVRSTSSMSWWDVCRMTNKGVILVRPDDHIAWTSANSDAVVDFTMEIRRVFSLILGKNSVECALEDAS